MRRGILPQPILRTRHWLSSPAAYQAGPFCVLAASCTREAVWEVLWQRRTIAAMPFCCYYVRLRQQDGAVAWVSPVWIAPE